MRPPRPGKLGHAAPNQTYKQMYTFYLRPPALGRDELRYLFRIMRVTTFLMLLCLMQVSARTAAQLVSLKAANMPLSDVFRELHEQTGYDFVFTTSVLEHARPVNLSLAEVELPDALEQIFARQPLEYKFMKNSVVVKAKALRLTKTAPASDGSTRRQGLPSGLILAYDIIRGRVVDSLGQPLSGASVRVINAEGKRTSLQTKTDQDGNFSLLNVPESAKLEITYIGYIQRSINAAAQLGNITLKNVPSQLDEVEVIVNTGYQTLPKERATGSFSHIDNKTFNQQVGTTIMERLEAVGNGIVVDRTYGSDPVIMVRGLSTIEGPREPLVVVDNFPYEGNIDNINPNDVESITILKDAAAASIWGARAGNGVIIIVTKKGNYDQPLSINLNANVTIGAKPDLFKTSQVSSAGFVEYEKFLYGKGYYNSKINRNPSVDILSPVVELLILRDKAVTAGEKAAIDQQIESYKQVDIRDDMMKYLYHNMVNQQYALNMNGGTNTFAWSASANYDANKDRLQEKYNRMNLQYRQSFQPLPNLDIQSSIYYTQSNSNSGADGYGEVKTISNGFYPYMRLVDEQGNPIGLDRNYRSAWTDTVLQGQTLDWKYYPLSNWKHHTRNVKSNDILINTGVNYRVIPSLSLDVKYQYEKQLQETVSLEGVNSWMTRYQINMWSQLTPEGTIQYGYPYGGKYQFTNADLNSHQFRGQLNLNQSIGEDHEIVAIAGGEIRILNNKRTGGGLYGFDEELLTFNSNFDHTAQYPSLLGGNSQFNNLMSAPQHTTTHFLSMFGNAAYSYRERYTLSVSARTDASNLFGLKTNDQWNPFYSLGLSWNIAKENFYGLSFLPNLRLRTTYGVSGNINPAMVAVTTMQYNYGSTLFGTPYGMLQNYYNPELRWETARQFNAGVDFGTRNQRLQGSIEYFYKRGTDLFGNALLDYTAGVGRSITKNVSSMKGNGLDVELNARIIDVPFKWQSRVNYSIYQDEIVEYLLNRTTGSSYIAYGGGIRQGKPARAGNPVNSVFSYRWGGLDPETGDPIGFVNGEKSTDYAAIQSRTTVDDLVYHGSSIPTHYGNWINSFGYKAFELHVGISYKLGYYFRREAIKYGQLAAQAIGTGDFDLRWQKPGDEQWTDVPSIRYPLVSSRDNMYEYSEAMVEKGDHIRLQYIQLNYNLQKERLHMLPFRSARVYVNANNLGVLWKATKKGVDPDLMMSSTHSVPGSYSVSVGLNINF